MDINTSKLLQFVTGALSVLIFLGTLYFCYTIFFQGPQPNPVPTLQTINIGVLGPNTQAAAAVFVDKDKKISFSKKDIGFLDTPLFQSFTDLPEVVPLSESRGRADPFVPYVAP